jgi:hypothetical protein
MVIQARNHSRDRRWNCESPGTSEFISRGLLSGHSRAKTSHMFSTNFQNEAHAFRFSCHPIANSLVRNTLLVLDLKFHRNKNEHLRMGTKTKIECNVMSPLTLYLGCLFYTILLLVKEFRGLYPINHGI